MSKSEYERIRINGKSRPLHALLEEEILNRPLEKDEVVHHINGDKHDNSPENLQVMTRAEHASLHHKGQYVSPEALARQSEAHKGRPSANRKLTEKQVKEIAEKLIAGATIKQLAEEYHSSKTAIANIRDGKSYRDWLQEYPDEAFPLKKGYGKRAVRQDIRRFDVWEVTDIRIRLLEKESVRSIAGRYGVEPKTIVNIRENETYQDIPWPKEEIRLNWTDDMTQLARYMVDLPLHPEKDEMQALVEDYLLKPDWRSQIMLRMLRRAAAGDNEIAMLLLAVAGYGEEVDDILARSINENQNTKE